MRAAIHLSVVKVRVTMKRRASFHLAHRSCGILICISFLFGDVIVGINHVPDESGVTLPKTIDGWTRAGEPRKITSKTIFDYMDGAGELYIGYRFDHLDVFEYSSRDEDQILAELYWMESSDDAFGLLSGDWGGEPADSEQGPPTGEAPNPWEGKRALYGSGLLRIWSGNLYARVMAYQETSKSKAAVMKLGRVILSKRSRPAPPALLSALPSTGDAGFRLRTDRVCYFRSHLVLNSVYFLSTGNILDLDHSAEAVTGTYSAADARSHHSVQLILVRYRDTETARSGVHHFERTYLPEKKASLGPSARGSSQFWRIEDGWLGYCRSGRTLALVFECPSRESAERYLNDTAKNLVPLEASHE